MYSTEYEFGHDSNATHVACINKGKKNFLGRKKFNTQEVVRKMPRVCRLLYARLFQEDY